MASSRESTAVVWFRRDLRLRDNPAWSEATARHDRVVPLFVIDPELWDRASDRRVRLLADHLRTLDRRLADHAGRLHVVRGEPATVVRKTADTFAADEVFINADVTPYAQRRDSAVADVVSLTVRHGSYVHPPGSILTSEGTIYQVFTPFHRTWEATDLEPWPEPGDAAITGERGDGIPPMEAGDQRAGELAAVDRLDAFERRIDRYLVSRDRPDVDQTSHLSVDLKYGAISPRRVVETVGDHTESRAAFVRQLAWRDFWAHIMWARPETVNEPMRADYAGMRWNDDAAALDAWTRGQTGYPLVDAGMRQLRQEGWIHNRVRMVCASFLVKDLLIDWRLGERWFRRQLLDGDVAQNVGNWQWVAGIGADAAPYFRIFNPVTQSRRFDPEGSYVRRWVPELDGLSASAIHAPWETDPETLEEAGVVLGQDYPGPIVDHGEARERTIDRYRSARR